MVNSVVPIPNPPMASATTARKSCLPDKWVLLVGRLLPRAVASEFTGTFSMVQRWVGGYEPNIMDRHRHKYMSILKH